MRKRITTTLAALAAAGGLAILLPGSAWAASGPQPAIGPRPASGTFQETSETVDSESVVDGNTILIVTVSGSTTGTFDGTFTETDTVVIDPDGSVALAGRGTQSGTLGTCGTGSAPYLTAAQGTTSARTGLFWTTDQAGSESSPLIVRTVDSFKVDALTGQGTYTGTYLCT
jgi:hypothetical protein